MGPERQHGLEKMAQISALAYHGHIHERFQRFLEPVAAFLIDTVEVLDA
jgi:hypothetical protein